MLFQVSNSLTVGFLPKKCRLAKRRTIEPKENGKRKKSQSLPMVHTFLVNHDWHLTHSPNNLFHKVVDFLKQNCHFKILVLGSWHLIKAQQGINFSIGKINSLSSIQSILSSYKKLIWIVIFLRFQMLDKGLHLIH